MDSSTIVWVDLLDPSPEQLNATAHQLGIGETAVEDALEPYERAKVTRHDSHLSFTVYGVGLDKSGARPDLDLQKVSGFVLPRGLVTVRSTTEGQAYDMSEVVRRWEANRTLLKDGVGALVHGLMDTIVDGHFETIQRLDDSVEDLEDVLFAEERTGREFAEKVYGLRKNLVALRRVVLPMREVVNALMRHRGRSGGELDSWYEDLYDHVLRASEWTESLRDMISSVFETNLSLQDARLNSIMKKLAAWAALIAIPTAITGWFGQNVPYPGFDNQTGLWISIVLIVGLTFGLYVVFRKKGWL